MVWFGGEGLMCQLLSGEGEGKKDSDSWNGNIFCMYQNLQIFIFHIRVEG